MRIAYCLFFLFLVSCAGGEKQIASKSVDIGALAHSSQQRFEIIYLEAGKPNTDLKVITSQSLEGIDEQSKIIEAISAIIRALPEVQDITNPWIAIIKYALIVTIIAGCIYLLRIIPIVSFFRWINGFLKSKKDA